MEGTMASLSKCSEKWRKKPVLLLDGGFSNELSKRCSYNVDKDPLWTARALLTDKEAVINTHLEYLKAGADIIETATYQATVKGLREGLSETISEKQCESLIENAVELAVEAVRRFKNERKVDEREGEGTSISEKIIAGSVGPYGVYLHDGSEYSGNYMDTVTEDEIIGLHWKRLEISGNHEKVDVLALETMPSLEEVEILLRFLNEKGINTPVWVSFMLKENDATKTARGESIADAFKAITNSHKNIWGFGVNCVNPTIIEGFLKVATSAKQESGKVGENVKLIVYPNAGKIWIAGEGWSKGQVPDLSTYAKTWISVGANVIGGCCLVEPEQIQKLSEVLSSS